MLLPPPPPSPASLLNAHRDVSRVKGLLLRLFSEADAESRVFQVLLFRRGATRELRVLSQSLHSARIIMECTLRRFATGATIVVLLEAEHTLRMLGIAHCSEYGSFSPRRRNHVPVSRYRLEIRSDTSSIGDLKETLDRANLSSDDARR